MSSGLPTSTCASKASLRRRARSFAFVLSLAAFGATAFAHLGHVVVRAERYLKLDVEPTQVRFVVSLTLGPEETVRIATAADTDENGEVTQAEADAYMAEWGRGLSTELPFEVDDEAVALVWSEPWMSPLGPIQRSPGTVEMVARVPLSPGRHTLRFRDGMRVETFDRTDVNVTTTGGEARIVAAGAGESPTLLEDRFAFGPQNAPGVVTAIVEMPGTPPAVRGLAIGGGVLALLVVLASWVALGRRRKSDAP